MAPEDEAPHRGASNGRSTREVNDGHDKGRAEAEAHLERRELRTGQRPGTKYVRIERPHAREFRRAPEGHIIATERVLEPHGGLARLWTRLKRFVIGSPLSTAMTTHERIPKIKALAVFASDALSSSAYATEEILLALMIAGTAVVNQFTLPITLAIVTLFAIVATAYRQTIHAYPGGGGAYIVTRDNLGDVPALIAGSSLLIGYVLTVAVSISAGVAAITSAVPVLHPYEVELAVFFVGFMTFANLRGVRESANIFTVPTYLFIAAMLVMFAVGLVKALILGEVPRAEPVAPATVGTYSGLALVFLLLRAFSSGCSALTGTEAISDGVPAFKEPQAKNAATTLLAMAIIAGLLFSGVSLLAHLYGIMPQEGHETVVSQIARLTFGAGPLYYIVQAATMAILILAANTAFADFPRLSYFLARDGFLPRQFSFRGDRLAFSTGIVALGLVSGALVIIFGADTHALIPLYAAGVFISFTCSQSSMLRRWRTRREPGWQRGTIINGIGALTCGVVAVVTAATKFSQGAWIILLIIPAIVLTLHLIHSHYRRVAEELVLDPRAVTLRPADTKPIVIVPLPSLHLGVLPALDFARALSDNVTAIHVTDNLEEAEALKDHWEEWAQDIPLVIIESPYRSLLSPLLAYIAARRKNEPQRLVTVVLAEFVPKHWWEWILHNQTALRLKLALFFQPHTVVADVPYHLKR
ncbi:MAG TPA: APC family permease [Chloroflexota bacterium]|nr:APC family permease [Chloroflexota bacterium]